MKASITQLAKTSPQSAELGLAELEKASKSNTELLLSQLIKVNYVKDVRRYAGLSSDIVL